MEKLFDEGAFNVMISPVEIAVMRFFSTCAWSKAGRNAIQQRSRMFFMNQLTSGMVIGYKISAVLIDALPGLLTQHLLVDREIFVVKANKDHLFRDRVCDQVVSDFPDGNFCSQFLRKMVNPGGDIWNCNGLAVMHRGLGKALAITAGKQFCLVAVANAPDGANCMNHKFCR